MDDFVGLLVRYLHVAGAVVWVGGYAVLTFAILPAAASAPAQPVSAVALRTARLLSGAGLLTILAGVALIPVTRGFGSLSTQWGVSVIVGIVLAVLMMGLGDGALRPALRRGVERGSPEGAVSARTWATATFVLGLVALAIMLLLPRTPA